ncbi:hypothetical protein L596_027532 [Steinernema carpocapsae]|uniref:Uncharacterized protein n=1 Tax=Steinernema carpocapsae TaxID=34508 RepID=A0A4U5LVS0_STECR|nr:hypothetical protein L596_027532 [Steinernema carpocapsae]
MRVWRNSTLGSRTTGTTWCTFRRGPSAKATTRRNTCRAWRRTVRCFPTVLCYSPLTRCSLHLEEKSSKENPTSSKSPR